MSYIIKDLGDEVTFGADVGGTSLVTYKKRDLYNEYSRLVELLGEGEASKLINSCPASMFVANSMSEVCGRGDGRVGDFQEWNKTVIYMISKGRHCSRKKTTYWTVGKATHQITLQTKVNEYLIDKFLPKSTQFFKVATYEIRGYIYISRKDGTSLYCSWENIINKDFNACLKATDEYYEEYYGGDEQRYHTYYYDGMHKKANLAVLRGFITHKPNKPYTEYVKKEALKLRASLDNEIEEVKKAHRARLKALEKKVLDTVPLYNTILGGTNVP